MLALLIQTSTSVVLLAANNLAYSHDGQRYLFTNAQLQLQQGARLALVGDNGCGKSTMLRLLASLEPPETGGVTLAKNTRLVYVEQDPALPAGSPAGDFIYGADAPAMVALRRFDAAAADGDEAEIAAASAAMDACGGWLLQQRVEQVSARLGVNQLLERDAGSLSGGERKRVALAAALLMEPDILLLDEPTNHLDIDAIRLLEEVLDEEEELSMITVTHDRAFLGSTCAEILELERGQLYRHRTSYEGFLEAKAERLVNEDAAAAASRNMLRREAAWMAKQPKARESKSKARQEAFRELKKRVDAAPGKPGALQLEGQAARMGTSVVSFVKAHVEAGSRAVLRDFSYEFSRGERIGVVGPNGAGKTTFLRALQQELPLTAGEIKQGETVRFGYYSQEQVDVAPDVRVLDIVLDAVRASQPELDSPALTREAQGLLRRFLFPTSRWSAAAGLCSGGERRRLQLCRLLAASPNFLLLDEPTNDLDLSTIRALEDWLKAYKGVLVAVSHDRYFLDSLCDKLFVLPADGSGDVKLWQGSFTDYLTWRDAERAAKEAAEAERTTQRTDRKEPAPPLAAGETSDAKADSSRVKPLSTFELKELERLEAEMEELGELQSQLQRRIDRFEPARNGYDELSGWTEELESSKARLSTTEDKFLELLERADANP